MAESKRPPKRKPADPNPAELGALLAATAEGDAKAFRRLYDLSHRRLYGLAFVLLNRRDAAQDVLQDSYLRVWTRATTYDAAKGEPMPWLARIVRNVALDRLRSERHAGENVEAYLDVIAVHPQPVLEQNALNRGLSGLRLEERRAWTLTHIDGCTGEEAAERLGVPVGTVKTWVFRGSSKLRRMIEA